ncbi:hypothetical protein [Pectobacterium brasiliense]|uniref:hypothetical protein n=1 Tax=Pectobacterium brasiliense TaxID=180957 RepID=UPI003DA086DD
MHAILTPEFALQRQYWRSLSASMQLHEKRCMKRAGVAGIALRGLVIEPIGSTVMLKRIKSF